MKSQRSECLRPGFHAKMTKKRLSPDVCHIQIYSNHVCFVHRLPCRSEMFQVISTMPRHHSSFCKATVQLPLEKVCPRRSATMANVGQPIWNCTSAWSSREATTRFLMVSLSRSSACQSNHLPSYHLCLVALRVRSSLAMLGL